MLGIHPIVVIHMLQAILIIIRRILILHRRMISTLLNATIPSATLSPPMPLLS